MTPPLMVRSGRGRYRAATTDEILEVASQHRFTTELQGRAALTSPEKVRAFLRDTLAKRSAETFAVIGLDNRHRLLEWRELFAGTIDGASVYPREVIKWALAAGVAAIILVHNHPSGIAEPSSADEIITSRLRDALALIDVRVLDHLIVAGADVTSLAERGLL